MRDAGIAQCQVCQRFNIVIYYPLRTKCMLWNRITIGLSTKNCDNFGVEYVGLEHFTFLLDILKKFHGIQYKMAGNKFAGMDIK
jgi:hypothetical protein